MKPIRAKIIIKNKKIISKEESTETIITIDGKEYNFGESLVLPGLVDAHAHVYGLGLKLNGLNLDDTISAQDCVAKAVNRSRYKGDWIIGRGWNQENWKNAKYPNASILDEAFPNTPVALTRIDGHAMWVNSKALELANIKKNTVAPEGGEIRKFKSGKPTGILVDNAMNLINKLVPKVNKEEKAKYILDAIDNCIEKGLTEIHDMDVSFDVLDIYKELDKAGKLKIRINCYMGAQNNNWQAYQQKPIESEMLRIIGLKFFADGALGSRGAALLEPYTDDKDNTGLFLIDKDILLKSALEGIKLGWQIATHAIGDAANRMVLDVYEEIRKLGFNDAILRIEHAQIVHNDDLSRFSELNIFPIVQPIHFVSDAKMMIKRLGIRANYGYPWRSFISKDVTLVASSDFPIESNSPWLGIDAFINRIPVDEENSWFAEEKITLSESFTAYTINTHSSTGVKTRGTLDINSDADMLVINGDFNGKDRDNLRETEPICVVINGTVQYLKQ